MRASFEPEHSTKIPLSAGWARSRRSAIWVKICYFPGSAGSDEVIITERPGDALTLACAIGFETIGILGAGPAANPTDITKVVDLLGDREAIIAGGIDSAGRRFAVMLTIALVALEKPSKPLTHLTALT